MLDTNGDIFPEGTYQFRVATVPEETDVKGYKGWQWSFEAETDEGIRTYNERFMVWLLAPLLRGLQFEELAPGKFDFEPTEALNRTFTATITHVTIEKGASAGKISGSHAKHSFESKNECRLQSRDESPVNSWKSRRGHSFLMNKYQANTIKDSGLRVARNAT